MVSKKFSQLTKGVAVVAALLLGGAAVAQSAGASAVSRTNQQRTVKQAPVPVNPSYMAPDFAQGQAHPPMPPEMLNRKRKVDPALANLTVKRTYARQLGEDFEARDGKIYLKKPIKEEDRKKEEMQQQAAKAVPGIAQNQMDNLLKNIPGAAGAPLGAEENAKAAEAAMRRLPQGAFAQPAQAMEAEASPD